jgi:hypothetical protein
MNAERPWSRRPAAWPHWKRLRRSVIGAVLIAGLTVAAIGGRPGRERLALDVAGTLMITGAVVLILVLCARWVAIRWGVGRQVRQLRRAQHPPEGVPAADPRSIAALLEVATANSRRLDAYDQAWRALGAAEPGPWPGFAVIDGGKDADAS